MVVDIPGIDIFGGEMSGALNETDTYIWNSQTDSDCLGQGAFGKVYLGTNKRTGAKVAVKTFRFANANVAQETQMLQTLKHPHIIQLYSIEYETVSRSQVMIMEYCNGGSLNKFLNEPENVFGLEDREFLLVLEHLSGGLEYLKRHNVIHRDVKPDNIMRHVLYDGRVVYKLADFGAARELPEGEFFQSLHGTEPYLHPNMYKVCYFRDSKMTRNFDCNTDLWSIGVTLYHIATGTLPFNVQERFAMLSIFKKINETEGIVSAFQHANSDRIHYIKKLPKTCQLSCGLKHLITPLIAGLFIHENGKQWLFTSYYNMVLELVARKVINVFYVNKMQMLKVYVNPDDSFNQFKCYIQQQTDVPKDKQIFFYKRQFVVGGLEKFVQADSDCVFLIDKSHHDMAAESNIHMDHDAVLNFEKDFMSTKPMDDIKLVYKVCRDLSMCKKVMEHKLIVYKYFPSFSRSFTTYVEDELRQQDRILNGLKEKVDSINTGINILSKIQNLAKSTNLFTPKIFNFNEITTNFELISNIKLEIDNDSSHEYHFKIIAKELSDLKQLHKNLFRGLPPRLHNYEKIKILHCVRTIMGIVTTKMDPDFESFVGRMRAWYTTKFVPCVQTLNASVKLLQNRKNDFKKYEEQFYAQTNDDVDKLVNNKQENLIAILVLHKNKSIDTNVLISENHDITAKMTDLISQLGNYEFQ